MTDDQKGVVNFYSGACISMFTITVAWLFLYHSVMWLYSRICGKTKTVGKACSIPFRSSLLSLSSLLSILTKSIDRHVNGIQAYVPVVNRNEFVTPLICADLSTHKVPLHHLPVYVTSNDTQVSLFFTSPHLPLFSSSSLHSTSHDFLFAQTPNSITPSAILCLQH
jgi:hypothetical protein